ncbi:MAG: metallophosphoesterase [Saprospiraceae bacterium]|nr:metallophosphoesterase [Saprospiraceae bacterium]
MRNLLFLLAFMTSATCHAQSIQHSEILSRPTDKGSRILLFFADNAEVCARFGTSSGNLSNQTMWQNAIPGQPCEITLTGLQPNTRYFYSVCYRQPGAANYTSRPEHFFHTQRPPGEAFTFVVQADPHMDNMSDSALYARCLQNQLADNPDFMVDLGDIFMSDKMKNAQNQITRDTVAYRVRYMRRFYEQVCHSMPLFMALGNHEGEAGWQLNPNGNNVAVYDALERKKYFRNPSPDGFFTGDETNHPFVGQRENYYAWHWGDALFVVLDPYWYTPQKPDSLNGWRWTLGKTQYDWLKNTLEGSPATFKFVFAHQLVGGDALGRGGIEFADKYEWGGKNLDGSEGWATNRPGWYKPIKDLLTENRVTTFFHGHDHFFAKQDKDCLVYQLCPQPSLPNFAGPNQADDYGYFAGQILPNAGHLRMTVNPEGVKTEYIRAYLPQQETPTRKNGDISATYFIGAENCYDSLSTSSPVLWNAHYSDELIYPNPSSGEVNISFSIARQERLQLSIFQENGQLVRLLLSGDLVPAGDFQVVWDGKNSGGQPLPAGVYFWKLNGENGGSTGGKLILQH